MEPIDPKSVDPESPDPNSSATSEDSESDLSLTIVSHCNTLGDAEMVVSLLGSFGIPATIESENYIRMLGSMLMGIDVRVRQKDAAAALEILNQDPGAQTIEE